MPGIRVPKECFKERKYRKQFSCSHCDLLLDDPVKPACGHRICRSCFDELATQSHELKSGPTCPKCHDEILEKGGAYTHFPDKIAQQAIQNLTVCCPYQKTGCVWEGVISEYKAHVDVCRLYREVKVFPYNMEHEQGDLIHAEINVPAAIFKDGSLLGQFNCVSCKLLLKEPVQSTCGHCFCKSCADMIIRNEARLRCPECEEEFEEEEDGVQYFPDRFVKREINGLAVICPFSESGCNWEGVFGEYQEHVIGCDFAATCCEYCSEKVSRNQLESHRQSCPQVQKQCPLACAAIGCKATTFNNEQLKQNMEEAHSEHFECLVEYIKSAELKVEENVAESQKRARDLVGRDSTTGQSLLNQQAAHGESHFVPRLQEVGLPHTEVQSLLQEEMESLQEEIRKKLPIDLRQRRNDLNQLDCFLQLGDRCPKAMNADSEDRDFRLSLIENSNHDGSMIWKIPQFNQRKADAENGKYTSIFSLPFYSGRYGYKTCVRLYIMGDGIGKGTHLSLFFVVMRGEFDNILEWPFTHKVTFKLINQAGGRDIVDTFQPDPMSSSFRKPRSDMNIASGCPRFVSHTELERGGFIMDDAIFVKCMIDTSTIHHP